MPPDRRSIRHCERSEAIQLQEDWIASSLALLAMTADVISLELSFVIPGRAKARARNPSIGCFEVWIPDRPTQPSLRRLRKLGCGAASGMTAEN
jgi:hypothetical protein